jgi:DNA-dependent protein kinase catalytic subunit
MADNALNSLEYWIKTIKLNKLKPYYGSILSKFDDYLQMNRVSNFADESMLKEKTIVLKISYKGSGRKKLPVKLFEKNTKADNSDIYEQIQLRILTILGQLAGEMSHCLFESNQNKQIIAWDTVQHLKFAMPFVDMKPQIDFDRFLSRIIYLSISSTHRQTKVNACELLHAIIIYMIGKSVSDPLNSEKFQMHKIYHHVYPALFKLSCDVDNFARNLFQPLVMQMIHWFTGNRKYESLETIELLNCIMTSLVDEKDAALRDFSAIALKEFLKWSIKHTPLDKQNIEKCSVNAKSILKRIFSFLNHPNCAKRLGATLAWNSIYTVFREEESLVNKYIFELLYNLIESLALAEQDDKMYGTQEQAKLGLDHCERIIRAKADLLNQRNPERNKPPGWSETVLEVAVRWLMRQCGRFETECRHKAMELAYKLSPLLIGNKEAKDYFQNKFQTEGETYFLDRFEGSSNKKDMIKDSLNHFQTLKQLISETGGQFRIALISNWLKILIAPLDCYSWVFSQRLLTPKNLFGNGKSCIWTSLEYFIKNIMNHDLDAVIRNETEMTQSVNIYTPNELEIFRQAKCTAIIRTIDFLVTMISYFPSESFSIVPQTIWCDSFFECILNLCLDPKLIGFNLNDLEIYVNLPLKTRAFFKCFIQNVPSTLLIRIKTMYAQQIAKNKELETIIENILSKTSTNQSIDWIKLSQLITGYEQLSEFNLYQVNLDLNRIIFDFLSNKQTNEEQESLTCVEAKRKLLNLCLSLNLLEIQRSNQLAIIANDYLIELLDKYLFQTNNLHIYQFFSYFKTEICSWICKRVEFITKYVLSKIKLNFARAISLLITLIDYLATDKQIRKQYGTKVVHSIYANWNLFIDYWQPIDSQLDHKALLIDLLTKSILIESINNKEISTSSNDNGRSQVTEMYMHLLTDKKTNLSFKCKILDLLYFFTDSPEPFDIKKYISQFVSDNFPFRSSELTNKENYSKDAVNDYISAVRKILTAIDLCGSVDLIKEISNVCCRETEHICDEDIHACLKRYIRRVDSIKQTNVINIYWDMVFNDSISNEKKSLVFKKILLTFMTNCDKPTFLDFMCKNINNLMNILEIELRENTYELNVLNARIVVELISLAYIRLHKDEIFHPSAKLCQKYEENKNEKDGKKLTKDVLKKCYNYLSEIKFLSITDSNELDRMKSLQYQFHCSAYNCLCSLFMRTQTDPKFYLAFLFKDDPSKVN